MTEKEAKEGRGKDWEDEESKAERAKAAGTARREGKKREPGRLCGSKSSRDHGGFWRVESLLPGRQQLNGWSVRRWEQC